MWNLSMQVKGREITKPYPTFEAAASALLGAIPQVLSKQDCDMVADSLKPGPIARAFWTFASATPPYRFLINKDESA